MEGRDNDSRRYRITVKGVLAEDWSEWLGGFSVEPQEEVTVISGTVADQAALYGLITRVRDLGLTLISIIPDEDSVGDDRGGDV